MKALFRRIDKINRVAHDNADNFATIRTRPPASGARTNKYAFAGNADGRAERPSRFFSKQRNGWTSGWISVRYTCWNALLADHQRTFFSEAPRKRSFNGSLFGAANIRKRYKEMAKIVCIKKITFQYYYWYFSAFITSKVILGNIRRERLTEKRNVENFLN